MSPYSYSLPTLILFFFQAEDGIRYYLLTGVQTFALPIYRKSTRLNSSHTIISCDWSSDVCSSDRKSTRLNSSHTIISYAVFCLKQTHNAKRSALARGVACTHLLRAPRPSA